MNGISITADDDHPMHSSPEIEPIKFGLFPGKHTIQSFTIGERVRLENGEIKNGELWEILGFARTGDQIILHSSHWKKWEDYRLELGNRGLIVLREDDTYWINNSTRVTPWAWENAHPKEVCKKWGMVVATKGGEIVLHVSFFKNSVTIKGKVLTSW